MESEETTPETPPETSLKENAKEYAESHRTLALLGLLGWLALLGRLIWENIAS